MASTDGEHEAVTTLREYLRVRTDHPQPDYAAAVAFLQRYLATHLPELPTRIVGSHADRPILIATLEGSDPTLPSILLNSHTDVVMADRARWDHEPFAAIKDEQQRIYGRGVQDMKSVTIQYLEAIRTIKRELDASGQKLLRTIHLSFVPDEEIGGAKAMGTFAFSPEFDQLNVGFALDEGLANPTDAFTVFYGERAVWFVDVHATGNGGHGSRFIQDTAVEKLIKIMNKCLEFRRQQEEILLAQPHQCGKKLGDVTSVNLTILRAGSQHNVVPTEAYAGMDIRVPPTVDLGEFEAQLASWCADAGVTYRFAHHTPANKVTPISEDSVWWQAFLAATAKLGLKIEPEIFPAATDSRYLRLRDVPALGFSPMNHTPILLHDNNEYLDESIFLRGIDIYRSLITDLANQPPIVLA